MTIDDSTPGSYFMALGFGGGYFGLQELSDKRKIAIFSIWDNWRGDNPDAVTAPYRVEVLAPGEWRGGDALWRRRHGRESDVAVCVENRSPLSLHDSRCARPRPRDLQRLH